MENFTIEIDRDLVKQRVNETIDASISKALRNKKEDIEKTLTDFVDKGFFKDKTSSFDKALDWVIDRAFSDGLEKAMDELNFKEVIADKAKELLSNPDFISDIAEAKVRSSLGLPQK